MNNRIITLDVYRAIAIIVVIIFHFFGNTKAFPNFSTFDDYTSLGRLGVQFFFMISGFVIFFTLEKTDDAKTFLKNRIVRLLPSMIIATTITFIFCYIFDQTNLFPDSTKFLNFVPSVLFISPDLLNQVFSGTDINFSYINGSYWSLWPEVQFYVYIGSIYYLSKNKFINNFLTITVLLIFINYLFYHAKGSNSLKLPLSEKYLEIHTIWFENIFNLIKYLPFFSIGVLFFSIYKNNKKKYPTPLYILLSTILLAFYIVYTGVSIHNRIVYLIFILLFILLAYSRNNTLFKNNIMVAIGSSSYFLYLIHEKIGLLIISSFGDFILSLKIVFTLICIVFFMIISYYFTAKIENRILFIFKKK